MAFSGVHASFIKVSLLQQHTPCCILSIGLHESIAEFGSAPVKTARFWKTIYASSSTSSQCQLLDNALGSYLQITEHTGESRQPSASRRLLWLQFLQREHKIAHLQAHKSSAFTTCARQFYLVDSQRIWSVLSVCYWKERTSRIQHPSLHTPLEQAFWHRLEVKLVGA